MAQNVSLWGASYSNVPSIEVPKTGGGTAQFDDTTIDSGAAGAADITLNKKAWVNGVLLTGTNQGGGTEAGTVTQDPYGYLVLDDDPPTHITVEALSVTQNGTYTATTGKAYSPVTVNVSGGGGGGGDMSDPIRFFDYDGTLVASYSSVPDSLPDCPTHSGLTSQGWNWTLSEIQTQFNAMGFCDVGHSLITSDGKTRIYIELVEGRTTPYLGCCPNGTVTIDWGDNSGTDTLTGTSLASAKHKQHSYASPGEYIITLEATSGSFELYGSGNNAFILTKTGGSQSNTNAVYNSAVRKIELGSGVSIGPNSFQYLRNLESISIPTSVTSTGLTVFTGAYRLKCVVLPKGTTTVTTSVGSLYGLKAVSLPGGLTTAGNMTNLPNVDRIVLPSTVTSTGQFGTNGHLRTFVLPTSLTEIVGSMFNGCYALSRIDIPASVASIKASGFSNCQGMKEYHFKPTTPPTLANTNAFSGIQNDCTIYVPAASLTAYQEAENWSTYASYMQGE